jgi:hypothetical protein
LCSASPTVLSRAHEKHPPPARDRCASPICSWCAATCWAAKGLVCLTRHRRFPTPPQFSMADLYSQLLFRPSLTAAAPRNCAQTLGRNPSGKAATDIASGEFLSTREQGPNQLHRVLRPFFTCGFVGCQMCDAGLSSSG